LSDVLEEGWKEFNQLGHKAKNLIGEVIDKVLDKDDKSK
jgi:hypothetical protein